MSPWVRGGLVGLALWLILALLAALQEPLAGRRPPPIVVPGKILALVYYSFVGEPDSPRDVPLHGTVLAALFWVVAGALAGGAWAKATRKTALKVTGALAAFTFALSVFMVNYCRPVRPWFFEPKSNLGAIRSTLVAYHAEWGVYAEGVPAPVPLPDRRRHPERVKWNPDTRFSIIGFAPESGVRCSYAWERASPPAQGFTARAECDFDDDGILTVYTLNDSGSEVLAREETAEQTDARRARESAAAELRDAPPVAQSNPGKAVIEEAHRRLGLDFVSIPAELCEVGALDGADDERPPRMVKPSAFRIGRTEVTQRQWALVMGANPSRFRGCDSCPVENVSWNEVQEFLAKASAMTGLELRLPREEEWECAVRGGRLRQRWPGTDAAADLRHFAWVRANSGGRTHEVCRKLGNRFGLCDMGGNVAEWVEDVYAAYPGGPVAEIAARTSGVSRVTRGGGWDSVPPARATTRGRSRPDARRADLGFRVALSGDGR